MSTTGFAPDWPAPPWVHALQTERTGGVSSGIYASLNLGTHVGDAPADVAKNRRRLVRAGRLPDEPVWLEQVHGTRIVDLDRGWSGPADGAVTGRAGVVCAVMTADCLPVLLAARSTRRIGVAHAGWRGLAAGILPAAIAALAVDPADIVAWLGPAIGAAVYEVGDEVRAEFTSADPAAAAGFAPSPRGRWLADLAGLARRSLIAAGVAAVHGGELCTYTEADRFFSHRRAAPCGRMATLIWMDPDA